MPTNFLGTARQKIFDGKTWYPLVCIKFFDIQIFWNIEGMPTNFFGTVRPKIFDGNLWYPLLCIKFFDTPNFLKHWRYAHEIFRHCETKTTTGDLDTPPPPYPNFFDTRNYCNIKGFPYGNFRHWEKNFWTENLDTPPPPLLSKLFRDQK